MKFRKKLSEKATAATHQKQLTIKKSLKETEGRLARG